MNKEQILPCPFCGGAASVEEEPSGTLAGVVFSVGCDADEAACPGYQSLTTFARRADAIEAWNRRVPDPIFLEYCKQAVTIVENMVKRHALETTDEALAIAALAYAHKETMGQVREHYAALSGISKNYFTAEGRKALGILQKLRGQ